MESYPLPIIGGIYIMPDGDMPFTVIDINHGLVIGVDPSGGAFSCHIESEPHLLDGFDL